jgi:hypothetical protein
MLGLDSCCYWGETCLGSLVPLLERLMSLTTLLERLMSLGWSCLSSECFLALILVLPNGFSIGKWCSGRDCYGIILNTSPDCFFDFSCFTGYGILGGLGALVRLCSTLTILFSIVTTWLPSMVRSYPCTVCGLLLPECGFMLWDFK